VVPLQRPHGRPLLWAPGGGAVYCRRTLRVSNLLRLGIRKPARISAIPGAREGAEGSSSVGRQREYVRRLPGSAQGDASANLRASSPPARRRGGATRFLTRPRRATRRRCTGTAAACRRCPRSRRRHAPARTRRQGPNSKARHLAPQAGASPSATSPSRRRGHFKYGYKA
jgi:hypothetical protein